MAEIKTLEQYAITRIQDLENEVEKLKETKENLREQITIMGDMLNVIKSRMEIKTAYDHKSLYINFDCPWNTSSNDEGDYEYIKTALGLKEPESEVYTDAEETYTDGQSS